MKNKNKNKNKIKEIIKNIILYILLCGFGTGLLIFGFLQNTIY